MGERLPSICFFGFFTNFSCNFLWVIGTLFMRHRNADFSGRLHRDFSGNLMARGNFHIMADSVMDVLQNVHAVCLGYFVTLGDGYFFGCFHRFFPTHFISDDFALGTGGPVTIMRIGASLCFGLCFPFPSSVTTSITVISMIVGRIMRVMVVIIGNDGLGTNLF